MIHRTLHVMRVRINENLAEPVYVQRSVRFQYSQTFLDPFVAPNKIITHFLLIAVVPILADGRSQMTISAESALIRRIPTIQSLYILLISISCCRLHAVAVAAATDGVGRWTKSLY
jgi:hypothetical protein